MTRRLAHVAKLTAVFLGALGALVCTQGPAQAAAHPNNTQCTGSPSENKELPSNGRIGANTYVCAGNYQFFDQVDGNLVIYNGSGTPIWASNTDRGQPSDLWMNPNGNFQMLAGNWSTNTANHPGAYVCFQLDGNMVVYAPGGSCSGRALWASGT